MGLFRCPKCDSICHTDEEVCHICGYRLKPEQPKEVESKEEVKPKEEKKEQSKSNEKFTIGSGFSRKSVFNSVSFDKKEEPKVEKPVVDDDPFAAFDTKEQEPKEDIFEAYSKQASDANSIFSNKSVEEKPIEPEVVKVDTKETKPIDEEPIVKPVEQNKVEEKKIEQPRSEETKVTEPKVEEKPKETNNPFINNGYNPASSIGAAAAAASPLKKREPAWLGQWRVRIAKNKKTATIWTVVLFILFIIFLILVSNDKKEVFHSYDSPYSYYRGDGYYTQEVKGGWVFLSVVTGIGSFVALIIAITYSTATIFVKELDGYHVLVYGHSNDFRLILENRVVDRYTGGRYDSHRAVRLSGKLPNNKIVFASIYYKNYERVIKVELAEDANKSIVNGNK